MRLQQRLQAIYIYIVAVLSTYHGLLVTVEQPFIAIHQQASSALDSLVCSGSRLREVSIVFNLKVLRL